MSDATDLEKFAKEFDKMFREVVEKCPGRLRFPYIDAIDIAYSYLADAAEIAYVDKYPEQLQKYRRALLDGSMLNFMGDDDISFVKDSFGDAAMVRAHQCMSKGLPAVAAIYDEAMGVLDELFDKQRKVVTGRE